MQGDRDVPRKVLEQADVGRGQPVLAAGTHPQRAEDQVVVPQRDGQDDRALRYRPVHGGDAAVGLDLDVRQGERVGQQRRDAGQQIVGARVRLQLPVDLSGYVVGVVPLPVRELVHAALDVCRHR